MDPAKPPLPKAVLAHICVSCVVFYRLALEDADLDKVEAGPKTERERVMVIQEMLRQEASTP